MVQAIRWGNPEIRTPTTTQVSATKQSVVLILIDEFRSRPVQPASSDPMGRRTKNLTHDHRARSDRSHTRLIDPKPQIMCDSRMESNSSPKRINARFADSRAYQGRAFVRCAPRRPMSVLPR